MTSTQRDLVREVPGACDSHDMSSILELLLKVWQDVARVEADLDGLRRPRSLLGDVMVRDMAGSCGRGVHRPAGAAGFHGRCHGLD